MVQPGVMIVGAGGVGGYFGAKFAEGGCRVKFIARGEHLTALRESGLRVETHSGDIYLPQVWASDNPSELGSADFILICVKGWDTESAARSILPIIKPDTTIISLQNGVQKDDVIRGVVGEQSVVGGVCFVSAKILRPGIISQTGKMQKLVFGEYDGTVSPRAQTFMETCRRSDIDAEITEDVRRAIWEKFVFLVGLSATTAAMQSTIGEIRANRKTREFLLNVMREVVAVGRAQGIRLDEYFAENRLAFCDELPFEMTSSMHNDLEQGKRLELPWLSGNVVEFGEAAGIPVPLNKAVSDILELRSPGKINKS